MFGLSGEALQNLQVAGLGALVGTVWRMGTKMATMNGTVAALTKEMAEHKLDDQRHHAHIYAQLERRGWFGWRQ